MAALSLAGCTGADPYDELSVDCGGKCDGILDSIRSLMRDVRDLDVSDLVELGAPFATDGINDLLEVSDYAKISIGDTELHDADSVGSVATGLAARFGERELSTEVNKLRADYLNSSSDEVFAEATFSLSAAISESFSFDAPGFEDDATVSIGFSGKGSIETKIITAFPSRTNAILTGPLKAMRQLPRGFIMPRSLDDIRAMKPGELVAMRAQGHIGVNLGVGVPLLVADPLSAVSYNIVFSAGMRTRLEGEIDIQLIRMAGDEVVIDVGIEKSRIASKKIAITDSWGVQGLLEFEIDVAGITVDLGRLAEKAIERTLNKRIDLIDARWEKSSISLRMSVARMRFNLDAGNPVLIETAIAQALRGDVRLAQALSNKGEPGIKTEFDMLRSGLSSTSFAGIDIFGLSFFRQVVESQGSIVIQTPGGPRTILFDSLHRESGWFISRHGYTRVGLAGLIFDGSKDPRSEANLFVQVTQADKAMERDKFLDNIDGLILGIGGPGALAVLEGPGNDLERLVHTVCDGAEIFDPCIVGMLTDPRALALREEGIRMITTWAGSLEHDLRHMLIEAAELRLRSQAVFQLSAGLTGPGTSIVIDYRLDDGALAELMRVGAGDRFEDAAMALLQATEIRRRDSVSDIEDDREELLEDKREKVRGIADILDFYAETYRKLDNVEEAVIDTLGAIGARAVEIRFPIDKDKRPIYRKATAQSIAQARAKVATDMFDDMIAATGRLGRKKEQLVAYSLLQLTSGSRTDLAFEIEFDTDDNFFFWREPYREAGYPNHVEQYAIGSNVAPIDGGLFDIDALIEIED